MPLNIVQPTILKDLSLDCFFMESLNSGYHPIPSRKFVAPCSWTLCRHIPARPGFSITSQLIWVLKTDVVCYQKCAISTKEIGRFHILSLPSIQMNAPNSTSNFDVDTNND